MASFAVSGIGSGLDVNSIVTQLMALERQPLNALEDRKKSFDEQLSAYGQLKSQLSTFQGAMKELANLDKFEIYSSTVSNEDYFSVTTDNTAAKGSYELQVTALAQAHSLRTNSGFGDTAHFGEGSLNFTVGGESFSVDVTTDNNTMAGIRDAINNAADNKGVTASIVNNGGVNFLTYTSDKTGLANGISVAATVISGNVGLLAGANLREMTAAQDATVVLGQNNSITISSESNTIDFAIEGVTLNLKKVSPAFETLKVDRDTNAVATTVEQFVNSYNSLQKKIESLRSGELKGDSGLLSIQNSLRNVMNTAPVGLTTNMATLSQVGIKTEKDGTLSLNRTTLDKVLVSDFSGISELFADDDQGFAFRMNTVTKGLLDFNGVIDSRQSGLNGRIKYLNDQITNMEFRMESKETSLRRRYSNLDTLLSQIQSSGSYLTQQLASLPGVSR
ncbi:MAG: flagellar filament capping protein FliD [Gammaproteobacteria bacterium]|nr:flagellar filament capping protein FliD [Gammaproteobacteria bacterium]